MNNQLYIYKVKEEERPQKQENNTRTRRTGIHHIRTKKYTYYIMFYIILILHDGMAGKCFCFVGM